MQSTCQQWHTCNRGRTGHGLRGKPFGPMPGLCAIADEVSKVHAICVKCGQLASFSHRTVKNDKQVLLGETAEYEPLCRECYLQAIKEDRQANK